MVARVRPFPAAALDVLAVVGFVVAGRRTHAEGLDLAGTAQVAWPFLVAAALGWLVARGWRAPDAVLRTGVPVWLVTVGAGLLLRRAGGDGTAAPFVVVAVVTLGVLMLGWRALAQAMRARARRSPSPDVRP